MTWETANRTFMDIMYKLCEQGLSFDQIYEHADFRAHREVLKGYDRHFFEQCYTNRLICLWAFQGQYNVDYFIRKFEACSEEAIDENKIYPLCGVHDSGPITSPEMIALGKILYEKYLSVYYICRGGGQFDIGPTPKQRVLNALKGLRQKWINLQIVNAPWEEDHNTKMGSA